MVSTFAFAGTGTETDPYTVAEVIALNEAGNLPTEAVYVKGTVTKSVTGDASYNNASYNISDDGTTTSTLYIYAGNYINNEKFTTTDLLEKGDVVVIYGTLTVYKSTLEMSKGNYIITLNGGTTGKHPAATGDNDKGGINNPYTPAEVLALTTLPATEVYVQGVVVTDATGTSYKNCDYYISVDGTTTDQMLVYRGKYVDGADFGTDVTIKAGTTVLVKGKIGTYNKKNQIAAGSSIVKLTAPTAIKNVTLGADDALAYNILGQRVSGSYKGIVIKGGKKFIQK